MVCGFTIRTGLQPGPFLFLDRGVQSGSVGRRTYPIQLRVLRTQLSEHVTLQLILGSSYLLQLLFGT